MSQAALPEREDSIAIAGGGIIGLSLAWRLAQSGWPVTVFDSGKIGGEASWAGAGMLACGGEFEAPSPLAALAMESRRLYGEFVRELEEASGLRIDYQECGGLDLAYSREELRALEIRAAAQAALSIQSKRISAAQVATFWPRVQRESLSGARFYPDDAIVDPRELVAALEAACRACGVRITPDCRVSRIDVSEHTATVVTANGVQTYRAAVVAAGAWSGGIAVTGVAALPFSEPVKGHLIGYWQPEQTCNTILRSGDLYLLQRANGLLIAGASVEHAGFDRNIDHKIAAHLAAAAGRILPHLAETSPSEIWTGLRPASDSLQMGQWHSPRLYLAYGHYRNGILLAPVTARRVAAEINANLGTR